MTKLQRSPIKKRSEDRKNQIGTDDFSENHYDKIVANVNNTRVRDQEERNKIFSIY